MNKAEKKNEKRKLRKQNQFENSKSDWRNVRLGVDDVADSSDTEDEDDRDETAVFMSLMEGATARNRKQGKVKICWVDGKIQYSRVKEEEVASARSTGQTGPGLVSDKKTMVKLVRDESQEISKEELLQKRKAEFKERLLRVEGEVKEESSARRKRKFGERMTLSEADVEDFGNSQDYVNFLQDKLKGVKIKLIS